MKYEESYAERETELIRKNLRNHKEARRGLKMKKGEDDTLLQMQKASSQHSWGVAGDGNRWVKLPTYIT